jgi:hypothetical protein
MSHHQSQLQAGSLDYNGPIQSYRPAPILLASNSGEGEGSFTTTIKVPVPNSQTKIKGSIIFVPASGPLGVAAGNGSVWVAACEEDQGSGGSPGRLIPVTNLEGNQAAPTSFPATDGLGGYSRSFSTTADWLQFVITITSIGGGAKGQWVFQSLIEPTAVRFIWEAWDQIRRGFQPSNIGGTGSL